MKKVTVALAVIGLSLASCVEKSPGSDTDTEPEVTGEASQAIVTQCPFMDPGDPNFVSLPYPIDFAAEMMITDVSVVDDPCRTTWTGSCSSGGTQGVWTFGMLMSQMAGSIPPSQFVGEWLHQWEIPLTINGFPVPAKPNIRPLLIDPWLVASGCKPGSPIHGKKACPLDLKKAPFRLLAIAHRPDLECANYTGGTPGEARFIFGALDGAGNELQAAIILEYKLPPQRWGFPRTAVQWEKDFYQLSDPGLGGIGSPSYLSILEKLLTDITSPGVDPSGPNFGSSIGQVRTNEIDFGGFWALREAVLQDLGGGPNGMQLVFSTTAETPDDSMNLTKPLDKYLFGESLANGSSNLIDFTQNPIPASFPGGESSTTFMWDHTAPTPLQPIERHHFAFNTCNGCHLLEANTPFLHVSTRPAGFPSFLSPMLNPTDPFPGGPGLPSTCTQVFDPAGTGAVFEYNEPWRRVCEATRMLGGHGKCWSRANGAH